MDHREGGTLLHCVYKNRGGNVANYRHKRAFYYAESVLCDVADACVNLMSLHSEIQSVCRSLPHNRVNYIVAMYSCSCISDFGITS